MPSITPFIRCNHNASDMSTFYSEVFPGSKITLTHDLVVTMEIFGRKIGLLNGGDMFTPNPSISFSLWIKDKNLCDHIWEKLSTDGSVMMAYQSYPRSPGYGRCNDQYGVSRQVMYDDRTETTEHALVPSIMYIGANNGKTQEAIDFYTSLFPESKIDFAWKYGENEMGENPMHLSHAEFKLCGQQFIAMDSGIDHQFALNEGVSLLIECDGQEAVDFYRNTLISNGGEESQCGRCKDTYGLSRQVCPIQLWQANFSPSSPEAGQKSLQAMMQMKKIIIADL